MKYINYTWRHLYNLNSAKIAKFKCIERCEVPQSDWVSGSAWGSPIAPVAPPVGGCYV
jgi:hypothetical protein